MVEERKSKWIDAVEEFKKESKGHIYFEFGKIYGLFDSSFYGEFTAYNYCASFSSTFSKDLEVIQYIKDGKIQYRYG